jgi:hypothetical protein
MQDLEVMCSIDFLQVLDILQGNAEFTLWTPI